MFQEFWRLLNLEYSDPLLNMAVEEAIPITVGKELALNTIRFWRNRNAVILGRFQNAKSEVNLNTCKEYGTCISKRFTGGGAVYQDLGNLNYAISIRRSHNLISDDILKTSYTLLQGVIIGLEILGLKAKIKTTGLYIDDEKISGTASAVKWGVFFLHGTLLVKSNLKILSEVLNVDKTKQENHWVKSISQKVTTLEKKAGRNISISEVKEALKSGFENAYNIRLFEGKLTNEEEGYINAYHNLHAC